MESRHALTTCPQQSHGTGDTMRTFQMTEKQPAPVTHTHTHILWRFCLTPLVPVQRWTWSSMCLSSNSFNNKHAHRGTETVWCGPAAAETVWSGPAWQPAQKTPPGQDRRIFTASKFLLHKPDLRLVSSVSVGRLLRNVSEVYDSKSESGEYITHL